jgi:hypothetical protein
VLARLRDRLRLEQARWRANWGVWRLLREVTPHFPRVAQQPATGGQPAAVVVFNASTRLTGISLNAAFSLLAGLGLQLAGAPVVNFVCQAGMSRCVLGAAYPTRSGQPPCRACMAQSRWLYAGAPTLPFTYTRDTTLAEALDGLNIEQLSVFEYRLPVESCGSNVQLATFDLQLSTFPLGSLVLPSVRWVLRRHHLADDEATRSLYREFISSAYNIAQAFAALLERVEPQAVVVFNGQFFPEAAARWVAQQRGIRVITHEVGFQPFSAFFTPGEATAYPLDIPADFDLDAAQNARLDAYLEQRFQGRFSMAGIRFWPAMQGLDDTFLQRLAGYRQLVPVFTNVIFDTSQPHSNVVFPHMFAWLDLALDLARQHPDTLFVLRAHPDELRPGKASRESVANWVRQTGAASLPNVAFVNSDEHISSYELIQRAKFVMIYNSTIGLEASIMGAAVLCGGRARFTQIPTVFFPATVEDYRQQAEAFLNIERIDTPFEFRRNARRFLYYQLYRSSLPFGEFLEEDGAWPGFVRLRHFSWRWLTPEQSPAMRAIVDGILVGKPFLLEETG